MWIFIVLFSCLIIQAQSELCNGRGYYNKTDGLCNCFSGFHGIECDLKYCPFGKSWKSRPKVANTRNREYRECSNAGTCDIFTGECNCYAGFEGRACERLTCPTNSRFAQKTPVVNNGSAGWSKSLPLSLLPKDAQLITYKDTIVTPCSGHGQCLSMREASNEFNGRTLIRPPTGYNLWDADAVQGCLCDYGWEGYDCSLRSCPKGPDLSLTSSTSDSYTYETFLLQCAADEGYFMILVLGRYTDPIPFDAAVDYLTAVLEEVEGVGRVKVEMETHPTSGVPAVCGPASGSILTTKIQFLDFLGARPPIYLNYKYVSGSRRFGNASSVPLALASSTPILRMATMHVITCSVCASCTNYKLYFQFGHNISTGLSVTTATAANIESAISGIADFSGSDTIWEGFDVEAAFTTATSTICDASAASRAEIYLYSSYGNLPFLTVNENTGGSISFYTNAGKGELYECSGNGICDYSTGMCKCFESKKDNPASKIKPFAFSTTGYHYRARSGDGLGNSGGRGDCSYIEVSPDSCYDVQSGLPPAQICNGHGFCSNSTHRCECYEGFHGINCMYMDCPKGPAWFDEAVTSGQAHLLLECSNKGYCDHSTGRCKCNKGYGGSACERRECPAYDATTGSVCNGNGWCMNTAEIFESFGLAYGDYEGAVTNTGATWDAHRWYDCVCGSSVGILDSNILYHPSFPTIATSARVNGIPVESRPLPGFTGYDCSQYLCPYGSNPHYTRYNSQVLDSASGEVFAQQRVSCNLTNPRDSFRLTVFEGVAQEVTLDIYGHMLASEIKDAIDYIGGIHNVTIHFPLVNQDGINTACDANMNMTDGGFVVTFTTELGPIPLMGVYDSSQQDNVLVTHVQVGNKMNAECSGETGYCDRATGRCTCFLGYGSGNGTYGKEGARGDCSFHSKYH